MEQFNQFTHTQVAYGYLRTRLLLPWLGYLLGILFFLMRIEF